MLLKYVVSALLCMQILNLILTFNLLSSPKKYRIDLENLNIPGNNFVGYIKTYRVASDKLFSAAFYNHRD